MNFAVVTRAFLLWLLAISGIYSWLTPSFTRTCTACGKAMAGAFVRALGAVYHLNCFKCLVCDVTFFSYSN